MIDKLDHYSITNPASVYDEEAMTALELVGRVTDKLNKIIDYVNQMTEENLATLNRIYASLPDTVGEWLEEHPDITTTIQNGEITESKLHESLKIKTIKDYITPQMFGAKGDGITDDTTAIQSALTYAETHSPHAVFFPSGKYCVKGIGSIFNSKFVSLIGDNAIIYVTEGDADTDLFTFTGTSDNYNGKICGLEFAYASDNYTMINNVFNFVFEKLSDILYNLTVSNCLFRKNKGYKIYTNGFSNGGFNNCKFNDNIVYGLFIKSLSFGDSNKVNGNSLYGSEEILLKDYVINLIQTPGSSGCEVASNNCSSGLGCFQDFVNLNLYSNQVENVSQSQLDFTIKIIHGANITIENCNINAHYNSNLVYSTASNTIIRNCNFYGIKSNGYAIDNGVNYHMTLTENVRYFDGEQVHFKLKGDVVNGWVTNTDYDKEYASFFIDSNLVLHWTPKYTGTINIAPLMCNVGTMSAIEIPIEVINGTLKSIRITNKYQLFTEEIPNIPALIPLEYF